MPWPYENLAIKLSELLLKHGIGTLLEPWTIRRRARAQVDGKVYEQRLLARVELEIEQLRRGEIRISDQGEVRPVLKLSRDEPDIPAFRRAQSGESPPRSMSHQKIESALRASAAETLRRELNLSRVILTAEDYLDANPSEPDSETATISEDWLFRWRDYASQVSSSEIQHLWARVIAREIKMPGSFSFRALDFLRNVTAEEASVVERTAAFQIADFLPDYRVLETYGVDFVDLLQLQSIGLVVGVDSNGLTGTYSVPELPNSMTLSTIEGPRLKIYRTAATHVGDAVFRLGNYQLTPIGLEVFRLANQPLNRDYLSALCVSIRNQGFLVDVLSVD
jgi:hypothetical protein